VTALVNADRVPAALQESLSSGTNALVAETPTCLPPVEAAAPAPASGGDENRSNGHGHKKHKHGKHGRRG